MDAGHAGSGLPVSGIGVKSKVRDSFLVFGSPLIGEAEIGEVVDSLRSGWVGTGPKVQRFEGMLSDYLGVPECRCVSSCTAALTLSMRVEWIERRAQLWDRYDRLLADLPVETPPPTEPETTHARHLYQVTISPDAPLTRDRLLAGLTARRIGTGVHYRGVHLHPYYRDRYGLAPEQFPVASAISERTLSLPLSPKVSEADQDVVEALTEWLTGTPGR